MANPNNRFARAHNFSVLADLFDSAISPENLYADGERTQEEANSLYQQLLNDYNERNNELLADEGFKFPR